SGIANFVCTVGDENETELSKTVLKKYPQCHRKPCSASFNRDVGELVILNLDVGVLADGIALHLLLGRHFLPGDGVHHLPVQAVAGGAVEGVEADFIGGGGGGVDGDGSAHQAQLEVALPVGAGGHV